MSEETPEPPEPSSEPPGDVLTDRAGRTRRAKIIRGTLAAFVAFVLLATGSIAYVVHHLNGNLNTLGNEDPATGVTRPGDPTPSPTTSGGKTVKVKHSPTNILVLGSDTRDENNHFIGGDKGAGRSDTAIVLHLSADRKWAVGASIPRDSMVEIPNCKQADGSIRPAHLDMFNEAYTIGGPICARDTVEQLTHLRMDHFLVVDFEGFRSMVNALGGVNVCLPEAIDVDNIHLHLLAGKQKLDGLQALGYVRVRHIGSGSDLDRIKRQQNFISALIQQVTSARTLFNPHKLYTFMSAATKSLTVDKGLDSITKLAGLGRQVRSIGLDNIQFVTVPTEPYPPDHNRLQWTSGAATLWQLLYNDQALPGTSAAKPSASASATPTPSPSESPLTSAPSIIHVRVLNGSGTVGAATKARDELKTLGYDVIGIGDTARVSATVVRYSLERDESARTLAAATNATTEETPGLGQVVNLVIGPDYAGAHAVTIAAASSTASPSPSTSFGGTTANQSLCS